MPYFEFDPSYIVQYNRAFLKVIKLLVNTEPPAGVLCAYEYNSTGGL